MIYILLYVLCMDLAAIYYYGSKNHKFADIVTDGFNFSILAATLVFDAFATIQFLICLSYLCCYAENKDLASNNCRKRTNCTDCCMQQVCPICTIPYFYAIFGARTQKKIWSVKKKANARTLWVTTGLMFAPLFSIASHSGYILIAWVTEPAKTTASFMVALGSILFFFFITKQCYKTYGNEPPEQEEETSNGNSNGSLEQEGKSDK